MKYNWIQPKEKKKSTSVTLFIVIGVNILLFSYILFFWGPKKKQEQDLKEEIYNSNISEYQHTFNEALIFDFLQEENSSQKPGQKRFRVTFKTTTNNNEEFLSSEWRKNNVSLRIDDNYGSMDFIRAGVTNDYWARFEPKNKNRHFLAENLTLKELLLSEPFEFYSNYDSTRDGNYEVILIFNQGLYLKLKLTNSD